MKQLTYQSERFFIMAIWHEQKDHCLIIHIDESELTEDILDRMRQVLTVAFLNRNYNLIFDLSQCQIVDSYFIGFVISTFREVKELRGQLKCAGVTGQVAHAFEVIGLNKVVDVYEKVEDAVAEFESDKT